MLLYFILGDSVLVHHLKAQVHCEAPGTATCALYSFDCLYVFQSAEVLLACICQAVACTRQLAYVAYESDSTKTLHLGEVENSEAGTKTASQGHRERVLGSIMQHHSGALDNSAFPQKGCPGYQGEHISILF